MEIQVTPEPSSTSRGFTQRVGHLVSRVPPAAIATISVTAITIFVVLGILQRTVYPGWRLANLDSESSIATYFSAALLWTSAAGWFLVALSARPPKRSLWIWSAVLSWLALDEGAALHERVEKWSGVDWQVLYLPILAVAALAWWGIVGRYRHHAPIGSLLFAGASAWATALLLELIQHWGGEPATAVIYNPAMITEEGVEMLGSTVFLIAALLVLRLPRRPPTHRS